MIPPDIRDAIEIAERVLSYAGDGLVCIEYDASEIRGALRILRAYLDTLPAAPAPDWSGAPEWANWWALEPDGSTIWHEEEPSVTPFYWTSKKRMERVAGSFVTLPIGIDWRIALHARPTEDK